MRAAPNASISPLQHVAAAVANYFGPWGVVVVRLVDFPNAGLRSFSWEVAASLTVIGAALVALGMRSSRRRVQLLLVGLWVVFLVVWFGCGFMQIATGLL